jgi:hypothetical protein
MPASRKGKLGTYTRFLRALPDYFSTRITLDDARAIIQQRLEHREDNFLELIENRILGNPRSPYIPMLRMAGCELGDLRNMVRRKGLEATLLALREAGVYLTFDELKGRQPIVRHGQVIECGPRDFNNPFLSAFLEGQTGGSSGAPTAVPVSHHNLLDDAPGLMVYRDAHGILDVPLAIWRLILPASDGMSVLLSSTYFDSVAEKWFWQGTTRSAGLSLWWRLETYGVILVVRLLGVPAPWPQNVPLDQAITVARWAVGAVRAHGACLVSTYPSMALRVSVAAQEHRLDLTGVTFTGGGDPPTEARVRGIQQSGAKWVPQYAMAEIGVAGLGCAQPADGNDNHLLKDVVAVIQHSRPLHGTGANVDMFYFTTLLPSAPKVLLNADVDDFGVLEERRCGCPLEALGLTTHVRHIRSLSKLKAEGMTIEGSSMVHVLEEVLPARFGGTPLDYQLVEEQDNQGFTRLNLRISPAVQIDDENEVVQAVRQALSGTWTQADMAVWAQAQTLRVERAQPIPTSSGKFLPLVRHKVTETSVTDRQEEDGE